MYIHIYVYHVYRVSYNLYVTILFHTHIYTCMYIHIFVYNKRIVPSGPCVTILLHADRDPQSASGTLVPEGSVRLPAQAMNMASACVYTYMRLYDILCACVTLVSGGSVRLPAQAMNMASACVYTYVCLYDILCACVTLVPEGSVRLPAQATRMASVCVYTCVCMTFCVLVNGIRMCVYMCLYDILRAR